MAPESKPPGWEEHAFKAFILMVIVPVCSILAFTGTAWTVASWITQQPDGLLLLVAGIVGLGAGVMICIITYSGGD